MLKLELEKFKFENGNIRIVAKVIDKSPGTNSWTPGIKALLTELGYKNHTVFEMRINCDSMAQLDAARNPILKHFDKEGNFLKNI